MKRIAIVALIALTFGMVTHERLAADPPAPSCEECDEKSCCDKKSCCDETSCCDEKSCCKEGETASHCCKAHCESAGDSECTEGVAARSGSSAVPTLVGPMFFPEFEVARQDLIGRRWLLDLDLPIIQTGYEAAASPCCDEGCSSRATQTAAQKNAAPRPAIGHVREAVCGGETAQVSYSIEIIEDRHGCLSEYEDLRQGEPMMFADSNTLLPAMRILHKHQLIRKMSSPKLICTTGHTAHLEIGEQAAGEGESWEGVRIEVGSVESPKGLKVELAVHASEEQRKYDVRTAVLVAPGQSIILHANAAPNRSEQVAKAEHRVYVVLTPELIK